MKTARNNTGKFRTTNFVPATSTPGAFATAMTEATNFTTTEKGALTNKSTLSEVLNFFGAGGALRSRTDQEVINIFTKAFAEDRLLTLKILFYFRDVREGQGERKTFRTILKYLATTYPDIARKNFDNVAFFGRYDDFYAYVGTPLEAEMFAIVKEQLKKDAVSIKEGKPCSLLGKWLKSENTSSAESRALGAKTRAALGITSKRYRQMLSKLRAHIDVLEVKMCSKRWNEVDYQRVPSKASLVYRKSFGKHDQERYAAYLTSVEKGEAKMNAGAVYPYEIFRQIMSLGYGAAQEIKMLDLQWNSMPNWLEGNEHKGIVIADTSGSMTMHNGLPMQVSVSLAIYFAQRNVGPFHNCWMNFSTHPSWQVLKGSNLFEMYQNMDRSNWCGSTNLQAAFDLILRTGVEKKVAQKDMPEVLYIVSDMEFDGACDKNDKTNFQVMQNKFEAAGYKLPRVVWWNVSARNDQFPIRATDNGTALVSGCSPSILKSLLSAKSFTPMDVIYETVNKPRYERVVV